MKGKAMLERAIAEAGDHPGPRLCSPASAERAHEGVRMAVSGVVDIDGVVYAAEDAKVSVFDRGFLYGDSVFEAMRTYGRVPFRQREHLERLLRSCQRVRIALRIGIPELERRIARAIEQSGLPESYIRVTVTRGSGALGLDFASAGEPSVVVSVLALKPQDPNLYRNGIAVRCVRMLRGTESSPALGAKTGNYLVSLLALDDAQRQGAGEAIFVDQAGDLMEGATSNLFVVRGGELSTPPLDAGILEGITRRTVIELAGQLGLACRHQGPMRQQALFDADEAFITTSIRELVPVVRADDATIGDGKPGATTLALLDAYRRRTVATQL